MKLWAIVLLMIVMVTCPAAELFDGAFGALDPIAVGTDSELVSQIVPRVVSLDDGSPAKAMGLKVGDRLVGLDGLQVIGKAEWDLIRYRRPHMPTDIRIAVLRENRGWPPPIPRARPPV